MNAFVTENTDAGLAFYTTHNGGRKWNNLLVSVGNRTEKWNWTNDLNIEYYYQGHFAFYYLTNYYNNNGAIYPLAESLSLAGQDGFKLEQRGKGQGHNHLLRTFDGGITWRETGVTNAPFDTITSFDSVTKNLIFACVNQYTKDGRLQSECVKMSLDGGSTWKNVYDASRFTNIFLRPSHVFFLDTQTGWISSDKDSGLLMTKDNGRNWKPVNVPEQIVCGIFFKDAKCGRIIGGESNSVFETTDGGNKRRQLSDAEITSATFRDYFAPFPLSRWNDFAVSQTLRVNK